LEFQFWPLLDVNQGRNEQAKRPAACGRADEPISVHFCTLAIGGEVHWKNRCGPWPKRGRKSANKEFDRPDRFLNNSVRSFPNSALRFNNISEKQKS
jgi:hypothetical protein